SGDLVYQKVGLGVGGGGGSDAAAGRE
ncbi:hypothetical protein A2U01_0060677, partial [Trifolium medium]|nr:hypothetical protein [Trifolium medium]